MSTKQRRGHPRAQLATCKQTGKVRFRDDAEAKAALHEAAAKRNLGLSEKRREVRTYECYYCGGWHLTSQAR